MSSHGDVALTPERRRRILDDVGRELVEGDVLFFFHRTSWRSRWIRRITGCDMPHVCVYIGGGRVVGMLRGRVRRHPLRRFFRAGYDLRFVRGSAAVRDEALRFLDRREKWIDLLALGVLVLVERAWGTSAPRRALGYRMRGVTCSGMVSTAWHRARGRSSAVDTMTHTPLDLERAVGKDSFFEARLHAAAAAPLAEEAAA